jgi:hypothetical protein
MTGNKGPRDSCCLFLSGMCREGSVERRHEGTEVLAFAVDTPEGFGQGRRLVGGVASADAQGNDELRDVDSFRCKGIVEHTRVRGFGGERSGGPCVIVVGSNGAGAVDEHGGSPPEGTHAGKYCIDGGRRAKGGEVERRAECFARCFKNGP